MSTESLDLPAGVTAVVENGLDALRINTELCTGLVYLNGAHVAEWTPTGQEPVLWMSQKSEFEPGRAIRGGVPICFPWFGPGRDGKLTPNHGFARLTPWRPVDASVEDGVARIALELTGAQVTDLGGFPADFTARLDVTFGTELEMALTVTAGAEALDFEEALHTYLTVSDVQKVTIEGHDGVTYLDKTIGGEVTQSGPVDFTKETDRIYFSSADSRLLDEGLGRHIRVAPANARETVIWNPWTDKAAAMPDFGDAEWPGMCCIETANCLVDAISLNPGENHTMTARISLEPLA